MKKQLIWLSIFTFGIMLCGAADAANLTKIRYKSSDEKLRIVFDLEGEVSCETAAKNNGIEVKLINCETNIEEEHIIYKIKDWAADKIDVKKENGGITVFVPLNYPVQYKIMPLSEPSRLVIDLGREFEKIQKVSTIFDGLDYFFYTKGGENGFITAYALAADPKKAEVLPSLATRSPNFFQSLLNIFTPWQKISRIHFHREKVSTIVDKAGAAAGINGTFFAYTGRPLGILVINGELITYPVYDRTALIINDERDASIDEVLLDSYVEIGGSRYEITGVNEPRDNNDVIIFTRHYGELTGTDKNGYELTVQNNKVVLGYVGNSRIPDNGYVISFSPMFIEHLVSKVKNGDEAAIKMGIIPYSSEFKGKIKHVVGGGPRLLKSGQVYVTKHFEKFKNDVAEGRAARSGVGVSADGKIILAVVDGKSRVESSWKSSQSTGATLEEFAGIMKAFGAADALNLDGGSSSSMVVNGKVLNLPVAGGEKPVSNALVIQNIP